MNKNKTIEYLLDRINLTISDILKTIEWAHPIVNKNPRFIEYVKHDFMVLNNELDLLIKVLNKSLKNGN
jgi:hypothetical protein